MLYSSYILQAKDLTITQDEDLGVWYLEPEWLDMLYRNGLADLENLEDSNISNLSEVRDILELEVKKRNLLGSKEKFVMDWLYDLITAAVEPAVLAEETEYIKQVTEFMKANHNTHENKDNANKQKDPEIPDNVIPFPTEQQD